MIAISQQEKKAERRHTNKKDRIVNKLWDTGFDGANSKGLTQDINFQDSLNKVHHTSNMIVYIADTIQGILNVCEVSVILIRKILTTLESQTKEVTSIYLYYYYYYYYLNILIFNIFYNRDIQLILCMVNYIIVMNILVYIQLVHVYFI